jgi:hypothetical protein
MENKTENASRTLPRNLEGTSRKGLKIILVKAREYRAVIGRGPGNHGSTEARITWSQIFQGRGIKQQQRPEQEAQIRRQGFGRRQGQEIKQRHRKEGGPGRVCG